MNLIARPFRSPASPRLPGSGILVTLLLFAFAFAAGLDVRPASAAFDDCTETIATTEVLILDVTLNNCAKTEFATPGSNVIIITANAGANANFDIWGFNDPNGSFSGLSITHDGGTTNIPDGTSFGTANDYSAAFNCSGGCTISGNYSGPAINGPFSVTYSQSGGSGALGPPPAPEIEVSASIGGAVVDGGSNAQGSQTAGSPVTVTYTVTNTGTADLTIATATASGQSNVTVGSIAAPGSTTVTANGGTTTFDVQYTPTLAGAFSFGLSFVTNDGDENPFNYTVSGTATGAPEISVSASIGGAVVDGGANAQGSQAAGSPVTVTYTVTNTGTADLTIATATASAQSNVTVGSIGAPGSTTVTAAGGTTTFDVEYTPTLAGAFSFGLSFVTDDGDENPFNYTVSGTATGTPEIEVSASIGGAVSDGGANVQGSQTAGSPVTVTYTVTNTGTADLTIATATASAASNVTVDSIGAPGSTTIAGGGGTTTFDVEYTPTLAGAFSFGLSFVTDDGDENPFNYTVSGTATGTPEIEVSASIGGAVADGGANAQGLQTAGSPVTVTYTVTNTGTADLTIAGATASGESNVTVGAIGAPGSTTLAGGGGTTTFDVEYTPTLIGAFSFGLSFVTDDGDENPFDYTVSGTAISAAEIEVSASIGGAVSDGGANPQGAQAAGSPVTVTYTVTNTGTSDLTIAAATASGESNVTVDSIGAPGSTLVTANGGTTTFDVQYTPTLAGAFSFGLSFVTDDGDENPFDFTVSGTATGTPEIEVSASIGGAVADGGANAQGSQAAGSPVTVTYTVTNTGTADLTIAGATASGQSNVTVGSIAAPGSTTIAGGGGTTTFDVEYTPTLAGAFSFGLSFVTDDGDENPFNFTVSGTATGTPEIEVSASIGGAVSDGGANAQGAQTAGSPVTVTYTVTNTGTSDLTIATATASGATNVTVNSVAAPGSTTITGGGGTTTFDVQYTPTLAGAFSFGLSFVTDDGDENPFDFTVSGTATGTPEISVSASIGGAVSDGGTNAQGSQTAGSPVTVTYTVTNTGTADLTIATATASGESNVTVGSIGAPGSTTIAGGGGTTTFDVQYTPILAGAFSFGLSFVTDDGDENPFDFTVSGTATGTPEIEVSASIGGGVTDGGTNAQGSQVAGSPVTVTYTITNTGTSDLTIATATASAASNVTVDSIGAPGSTTVTAAGGTTTFDVEYTPTLAGAFSFNLSFVNDDGDENPFDFTVSGTATGTPEIEVSASIGGAVSDGGANAQGAQAAGSPVTVTYTVTNTGTADLTIATATASAASNVTVGPIGAPGSTTVTAGGGTTTFDVEYTPTLAGAFSFALSFVTDDGDENPFNFTVSGTATGAPEIEVSASIGGAVADGGTNAQGSQAAGSPVTVTYTVTNTGTADLTIAGATASAASNVTVDSVAAPGSSTITGGGGTTTFDVEYTPTLAGAFSFGLSFVTDDSDENPFNYTVSGTATGTPEIAVSASIGGAVADGGANAQGSQTAGSPVTVTYTVTNSGTGDLTIGTATASGQSNVTVGSIAAPGSTTVAAGGGTTTFDVEYTPTLAGAFSFGLSFVNDDGDENPFNYTVSGTATGAPEIEVSSSEGGAVADGGTDTFGSMPPAGTAATVTYTITNSGTDTLTITPPTVGGNVSGQSNVTVNSLTLGSTMVAGGGGTTTLVVSYTPTAAGAFGFELSFSSTDADESPYDITAGGTAGAGLPAGLAAISGSNQSAEIETAFAAPLVAMVSDSGGNGIAGISVTFTAPATGPSLVFASTGTNTQTVVTDAAGEATSSAMTANAVPSDYLGGSSFASYTVTASSTGLTSVGFSLTNLRDSDADIQKTREVIASFVTNRADRIVAAQPDLVDRLKGRGLGLQTGANSFFAEGTPSSQVMSFQFSMRAFANRLSGNDTTAPAPPAHLVTDPGALGRGHELGYAAGLGLAGGSAGALSFAPVGQQETVSDSAESFASGEAAPKSGFDFWMEGTYARVENGNNESNNGIFFAGIDYRIRNDAVIGLTGQLDISDERNLVANTAADGVGWMAGPYAVVRLNRNLYFDARATYGRSSNQVNALGLFTDDFDTSRFLLQAGLTGDFRVGSVTVNPFARVTYFSEDQESYVDSLGNSIGSQTFDLGRLEFGPKVTFDVKSEDEYDLSMFVQLSGIYDFNRLLDTPATNPTLASSDESVRARVEAGGAMALAGAGTRIRGSVFYDGLGTDDFQAYGGSLGVRIPF
ncbi:hypothetical protein DFR52_102115 [Hoeflea marina]|uniref:Autotransporter domain-containing protein n=1 Tax=Hoeflea marina TaxID=274592 RepID=A0A317PLR4_9HYPH|nr:choice-of-anchor D domain-containing protein [Hoeflea marina]PWW01453.1 hypothetical protein DFR52_102115 [Hoeflea marina]